MILLVSLFTGPGSDPTCVQHDSLGGVDEDDNAVRHPECRRHLVAEVDVSGRVENVHQVRLATNVRLNQGHRHGLDGNTPLLLREEGVGVPERFVSVI